MVIKKYWIDKRYEKEQDSNMSHPVDLFDEADKELRNKNLI